MDRQSRPLFIALGIYTLVTALLFATSSPSRLGAHTPYNHFALLAEAWVHGRLDLGSVPPAYTGNNDFAYFEPEGKYYVSFPPFPAVLIAPLVKIMGRADRVRDAAFFLGFAGIGPAVLFLALDKLRALGRSRRTTIENAALALLFAFGTVYWFSAVQGTVWFVAHVVGVALAAIYIYCCIDAAHPVSAGTALALGFATRTPLAFAFPLFLYEAYRKSLRDDPSHDAAPLWFGRADARRFFIRVLLFAIPVTAVVLALFLHNYVRFGDPLEFGHGLLMVVWRGRIEKWGLFSYHYLARNLGVMLTLLPFIKTQGAPFQINGHGLALWFTSPFYVWALAPKRPRGLYWALASTALLVAAPSLFYQNSGWIQFGYRFSNDFAPFVMVMIALSSRRLGASFWLLGVVAVVVNGFGAMTFQRTGFDKYYFIDPTQTILYQPD